MDMAIMWPMMKIKDTKWGNPHFVIYCMCNINHNYIISVMARLAFISKSLAKQSNISAVLGY